MGQDLADFVAEAEAEADAETSWEPAGSPEAVTCSNLADEVELLKGVSGLESDESLAWPARSALLLTRFEKHHHSTEEGSARFVCELLSSLVTFAGASAAPSAPDVDDFALS